MKKYLINLDRRTDRLEAVMPQFEALGWEVERFSAYDTDKGWVGCTLSHIDVILMGYSHETFMVLEDDVVLDPTTNLVLEDAMSQLPEDWDMLYLGCSPKEPQVRYSDNLFKLNNAHVTHAIIWNGRPDGAFEYVLDHADEIEKIDDYFATVIQPRFNCFVTYPMVALQNENMGSDIAKFSDVSQIWKSYKLYCK